MTDPALQGYTGGILNMTGTRPEDAFKYDGPAMQGGIWYSVTFESTYDAIEKLVVPPGLTVNRDVPPTVELQFFVNPRTRAFDGRLTPYKGFMFMAHVKHGDVAGRAGWEYVDGLYGDKTHMDIMGPWSVYFGMLKKMADIHFTPIGGNEFEATVTRRGVRLATLTIRVGTELAPEDVELINASSSQWPRTLTVREIPNVSYSGLSERTVCIAGTESANTITRAWAADKGTVSFGRDELDPLDELPVLGVTNAMVYELDCAKELFSAMTVLEHLPGEDRETAGSSVR